MARPNRPAEPVTKIAFSFIGFDVQKSRPYRATGFSATGRIDTLIVPQGECDAALDWAIAYGNKRYLIRGLIQIDGDDVRSMTGQSGGGNANTPPPELR